MPGKAAKKTTRVRVETIRFFARTMDTIVKPDNLYLELEVPGEEVFDPEAGKKVMVVSSEGFALAVAEMTDRIEVAVRAQQAASVKRG